MTDYLHETPSLSEDFCPGCTPERDPLIGVTIVRYCHRHETAVVSPDDGLVPPTPDYFGYASYEAGGESNKKWCDFLHRRQT